VPPGRPNAPCTTSPPEPWAGGPALTPSPTVIVAGAGIGGLTAALALARRGFRVSVLEQGEWLQETGAGIQLSSNATRILIDLGLANALRLQAVAPTALCVRNAASGQEIVRMPLGEIAERRYGAPYWVIHRGDLQAALADAVSGHPAITVRLGMRVENFLTHSHGVRVLANSPTGMAEERGLALLAADGLWSLARNRIGDGKPPRFAGRTAWRALVPADQAPRQCREPLVQLWLGRDAHLVHYPVKAGRIINVVVVTTDSWNAPGWSEPAAAAALIPRLTGEGWPPSALSLIRQPDGWLKWALYDRRPLRLWSHGAVALLGDAAHPMLPFLAQGAAMAIEDAAVAAHCLARQPDDAASALRAYCAMRCARTARVQRLAARNGARYHLSGVPGRLRDVAMRMIGGERLLHHYDWLYNWRPPAA